MNIKIVRNSYTFIVWLSMLGGIRAFIGGWFRTVALGISRKLFMNNILNDIFFVKKRGDRAND